ncbi:hypothetical protein CONPUDRAFT_137981 [Coniophora puteana RWD-64-598 SS2]|uniref:Uncharacterized protein n=1 Tax=Coniophora puteana (strain RWD-64-598) TaxID=741705 RepID=A0A5M3MKZ8_CONPW|nr:uncharacterized protein CONPUDRAFT_137981 [Coniophora puteana RWD-64-598 SS2]EIW79736.1 hypothetical protein CONPUDRAFT_137981 [Coniophora puteana RWD-64-598 SS2]
MTGIPQMRARSGLKTPDASEPPRPHEARSPNTKLAPNATSSGATDHHEKPKASALPKTRRSMLPFIGRKKIGGLPSAASSQTQLSAKMPPQASSIPATASDSISRSASVGNGLLKAAPRSKDSARKSSASTSSPSPTLASALSTPSSPPPPSPQMPSAFFGSKFAAHFTHTKSRRSRLRSTVAAENSQSTPPPTNNTSSTHIANLSFESRRASKERPSALHPIRNVPVVQREFPMEEYTDLFVVPFSELHGKPPQATKPPSKVAQIPPSPTIPSAAAGPSSASASKPPTGIPQVVRTSQSSAERSSTRISREPAFRGETAASLSKRTSGSMRIPRALPSPTIPTTPHGTATAGAPSAGPSSSHDGMSARDRSRSPPQHTDRPEAQRTGAAKKAPSPSPAAVGGASPSNSASASSKASLKKPFISRRPSSFQNSAVAPSKPPSRPLPSPPPVGGTATPTPTPTLGSAGASQAASTLGGSVGPSASRGAAVRARPRASTISTPVDAVKENTKDASTSAGPSPSSPPSASSRPDNGNGAGTTPAGRPAVDFDPLSCLTVDEMRHLIHRQRLRHNELQDSIVRITRRHADEKGAMMKTIDELQKDLRRQAHEIEGLREIVFNQNQSQGRDRSDRGMEEEETDGVDAHVRSSQSQHEKERGMEGEASPTWGPRFDYVAGTRRASSPTRLQPGTRSRGSSPQRVDLNTGVSAERLRLDMEYLAKTEPALLQPHYYTQDRDAAPSSGASASSRSPISSTAALTLTPTTTSSLLDSIPEVVPSPSSSSKITRAERARAKEERRESRARCESLVAASLQGEEGDEEPERPSYERMEMKRKSVDDALQKLRLFG